MSRNDTLAAASFGTGVVPRSEAARVGRYGSRRVLHVLKHCGYGNGNVNVAIDLACVQAAAGCEVAVASGGGVFVEMLARYGIIHFHIDVEQRRPFAVMASFFHFLRFVRSFSPDVIHAHMMGAAILGWMAATIERIPLITTVHNSFDRHSSLMRLGRRVVAVSEAERKSLIDKGYSPNSLDVVLNAPVGSPRESCFADAAVPVLRSPAVLAVCGLHPRKGVEDLLGAWCEIAHEYPDWRLYIAGEGPDKESLETLADRLGIANSVVFLGFVAAPRALFLQAEIFVLASHADPCSLVIGEARGAGCAIVATAVGGTPEMLAFGEKGLLVPPRDSPALARALSTLMGDPVACAVLKAASSCGSEQFHVSNLTARYERVYEKALDLAPQPVKEPFRL